MSFGSPANGILKKLIQKGCNDLKKKNDEQRPEGSEERKRGQAGKNHFLLCPGNLKDIRFKASAKKEDMKKQAKELIRQSFKFHILLIHFSC